MQNEKLQRRKPPAAKRKSRLPRANEPLGNIGEFGLVGLIARQAARAHAGVLKSIGDDAAVVAAGKHGCLLITTDVLNESVHFRWKYTSPYLLGKKSLSVNLSDIAAMGGEPLYYFVSLSVPPDAAVRVVRDLYRGMDAQAKRFGAVLLGGDTVAANGGFSIAVTMIGSATPDSVAYRSGARPGDLVYVSGTPGDSALGLALLEKQRGVVSKNALVRRHLDPEPRIALGRALVRRGLVTSMIDVSDGIAADLGHILSESKVGAEIRRDHLPLSRAYRTQCASLSDDFYHPALCGGEDYELLFTVARGKETAVQACAQAMKVSLTCIGSISGHAGRLRVVDADGREYRLGKTGYRHF